MNRVATSRVVSQRSSRVGSFVRAAVVLLITSILLSGCSMMSKRGTPRDEVTYQVASGDTLQKVGAKFGIPAKALQTFNGISDPRSLRVGQLLRIPAVGPLAGDARFERVSVGQQPQKVGAGGKRMVNIRHVRSYMGNLKRPVDDSRYTSAFGWRWGRFHEGIDLAAKEGEKILASHDGTVVFVSESHGRYGKMVVVKGEKLLTVYGHNSMNRVDVGDQVEKGEWIADVGSTGNATGPHLHLETRILDENGFWTAIDPMVFYKRQDS
jgi:murein DD-endopeptidase MepM/ murein hydrolase activator NlpD